jgi:hypothetical protein
MKLRTGLSPRLERLGEVDLAVGVGLVGVGVDLVDRRPHDEEGQEEAEADDDLVRRRRLRAERLPQTGSGR